MPRHPILRRPPDARPQPARARSDFQTPPPRSAADVMHTQLGQSPIPYEGAAAMDPRRVAAMARFQAAQAEETDHIEAEEMGAEIDEELEMDPEGQMEHEVDPDGEGEMEGEREMGEEDEDFEGQEEDEDEEMRDRSEYHDVHPLWTGYVTSWALVLFIPGILTLRFDPLADRMTTTRPVSLAIAAQSSRNIIPSFMDSLNT